MPRGRHLPPQLGADRAVAADRFPHELIRLARGNSKLSSFGDDRIAETAELLSLYGIATAESFRATGGTSRRFLL